MTTPLATSKIFTIFALPQLFNGSVNHRIYSTYLYQRLGVVYPYSNGTVVSGCGKPGKATLSLYRLVIKFFTNATTSKRFSSAEEQYAVTNAHPSDRGATNQKRTKKKELRKATPLPAIGLLLRELHRYVRGISAKVVQNSFQNTRNGYTIRPNERQSVFCQRENLCRSIPKSNDKHTLLSRTYTVVHSFIFIYCYFFSLHRYGVV